MMLRKAKRSQQTEMSVIRKAISLILAAEMFLSGAGAVEDNAEQDSNESWVNSEELDEYIDNMLSKLRIEKKSVSVAMMFTGTGEHYYYNADSWMYSASLYKMPVCMTYSHKIKTGEIKANSLSGNDAYIYDKILGHSDFCWVSRLEQFMYGNGNSIQRMREQDLEYSGFDKSGLPFNFYRSSMYSARFYLGIVEELYNHSEEYPDILDYMTGATPTKYFCRNLGDKYAIAQKYGSDAGCVHAAGIIYTDEPILLVIMTFNKSDASGNRIIGTISEEFANRADEWSKSDKAGE